MKANEFIEWMRKANETSTDFASFLGKTASPAREAAPREPSRSAIQEVYDNAPAGRADLSPGTYHGQLVIDQPGVVDGHGATLVADTALVVLIMAEGVTLRNLKIVTTAGEEDFSVTVLKTMANDTVLDNIELRGGTLSGFQDTNCHNIVEGAADTGPAFPEGTPQ